MSYIAKCQCFESYFSEVDVRNHITAKTHVWSPIIAIMLPRPVDKQHTNTLFEQTKPD